MNYKLYMLMKSLMLDDIETENLDALLKALSFAETMNRRAAATAKELESEPDQTSTQTQTTAPKFTPTFETETTPTYESGVDTSQKFVGDYSKYGMGRNNIAGLVDKESEQILADYVYPGMRGPRSQENMHYAIIGDTGPYYAGDHQINLSNQTMEAMRDWYKESQELGRPMYHYRTANRAAGYRPGAVNNMRGVFGGISPATALRYDVLYRSDDGTEEAKSLDPSVMRLRNNRADGKISDPKFARGTEDRFEILETPLDPSRVFMPELTKNGKHMYQPVNWDSPQMVEAANSGNYDAILNPFTGEIVILGNKENSDQNINSIIGSEGRVHTSGSTLGLQTDPNKAPAFEHEILKEIRRRGGSYPSTPDNVEAVRQKYLSEGKTPEETERLVQMYISGYRDKYKPQDESTLDPMGRASRTFSTGREPLQQYKDWSKDKKLASFIMNSNLKPETKSFLMKILK